MASYLENAAVERLVEEVAEMTGESETETVRKALEERKARPQDVREDRTEELMRFLREEIWPKIPPELLGRGISQAEQDEILGYGAGSATA
jgi:antitoxin VapB